jgi:hypothetical protein
MLPNSSGLDVRPSPKGQPVGISYRAARQGEKEDQQDKATSDAAAGTASAKAESFLEEIKDPVEECEFQQPL